MYPVITKPCTAWGSQGIYKASNEAELFRSVAQALAAANYGDILTERYYDGPEIDANFVLQDGNAFFFEVVDGFPCTADMKDTELRGTGDFLETDQLWPTNHPEKEQAIVREKLLGHLLQMGITNGVFHLEARIQNSSME
jgi:hypothetical protein